MSPITFPHTFVDGESKVAYGAEVMANLNLLKGIVDARSGEYSDGTFVLGTEYTPSSTRAAHVIATAKWYPALPLYCVAIFFVGAEEVARIATTAPNADVVTARTVDFIVPAGKKWSALKEGETPALGSGLTRTLLL